MNGISAKNTRSEKKAGKAPEVKSTFAKTALFFLAASFVSIPAGCSLFRHEVKSKYESVRTDVFTELNSTSEPPPSGSVNLEIKASIKKHVDEEPEYAFVVNIDGQAVRWNAIGRKETLPVLESAEGGAGMKYYLDKTLRLSSGHHDLFFAVPEDDYSVDFDVSLKDGRTYLLEFVPVYRYSPARDHISSFSYGIYRYDIVLSGKRQELSAIRKMES